jgi:quercetin dioxygenase-like cupin family protein
MATVVSKTLASRTTLAWQPFDQVDGFSNKGTKLAVDFSDPKVTLLFVHIEADRSIATHSQPERTACFVVEGEGSIAVEGHMNVLYASGDVITFESNAPHGRQMARRPPAFWWPFCLDVRTAVVAYSMRKAIREVNMPKLIKILAILAILSGVTLAARAEDQSPKTDPAILATVDALVAALNSGSTTDAKAIFVEAPTVVDDFPPFAWSGKDAAETYTKDLKTILDKLEITAWRFQRHQPRYAAATNDHAWLVVPFSFPFMMKGQTQSVAGDWSFVLQKIDGRWRVVASVVAPSHNTLLP